MSDEVEEQDLHTCGYPEDSFACKIRHISLQTGAASMGRIRAEEKRKEAQVRKYGV